ncbi:RNA polymerase subunit sigma-70 [Gilvibacter sp. SZ-19]|uniref:RNA polymerase sigma factor n=1 Tax=Gilvibacter sp. SZ-19 TaxID=754429 RepID=UPI000B3C4CC1|nr:RNA polymerase sigma factor [Gilvibacter sp. SZ-19]ARV12778.1 RNA polymerase subunit sigma-70 [Gilvibacter sp. SZ-19]
MSDLLLIERCKQNDRKAQMAVYNKYCEGMLIIAKRYMKDTALAEDAMQEGFIKAFQKLAQFKGDVTFGAWLKRIVINTCLDTIKAQKAVWTGINEEVMSVVDDQDHTVPDGTTVNEVKMAIANLPEKYRLVTQMFYLEGYDHSEIASIMNISEAASRTCLFRGKSQIKKQLKHLDHGTGY